MQLTQVDSTVVYACGYDDAQRTLDVVFYRSGVYRYFDVPREVYDNLIAAESQGRFLHQAIFGAFAYQHLRPPRKPAPQAGSEAAPALYSST